MKFGSVCSGIEAASAAWQPLQWQCSFMAEIEAFPRAVLTHHYPEAPLHGDFTTIKEGEYDAIDVLVGGTPCQSFSVAGLRGGMADERGNLALEYLRLAERLRPRWLVWENVPGVLSSGAGRDFGAFVGGLAELGYGWAYRVLDAQYFGLAQRRKRVFVVGCLGDWRRAAAVLFEPASLRWNSPPSRTKGEGVAASLTRGADSSGKGGYAERRREDDENLIANPLGSHKEGGWRGDLDNDTFVAERAPALSKSNPYGDHESREGLLVARSLNAHAGGGLGTDFDLDGGLIASLDFQNQGNGGNRTWAHPSEPTITLNTDTSCNIGIAHALRADDFDASEDGTGCGTPLVAFPIELGNQGSGGNIGFDVDGAPCYTLQSSHPHATATATATAVRRLTPRECERLQGFPDDYTLIPYRGKPAADGPRYRALGNSMAVPVMVWIGRRIEAQSEPPTLGLF